MSYLHSVCCIVIFLNCFCKEKCFGFGIRDRTHSQSLENHASLNHQSNTFCPNAMERQGSFEMNVTPRQKCARETPCPNTATIVAVLRNIPRETQSSRWSWSHQSKHSHWLCCDRKSRSACAQSFAPWQQATIEITR